MAKQGTSFRELISYATGKSNASREDLESSLAAKGYKPGDIRRIGKAYDRVSSSGDEYVLHPEKGFNVLDSTGAAKTGSGKRKGNKAGRDLGDLIGLGNDVSLLAGALRQELPGYETSKAPAKQVTPETPNPPSTPETDKQPADVVATKKAIGATGAKRATKAPTKTSFDFNFNPDDYKLKYKKDPIFDLGKKSAKASDVSTADELAKVGSGDEYPALNEDDFFDMSGVTSLNGFSDLTKKTKNDMITLGKVGAFAGPWHRKASKFYNKALLPLQLGTIGLNMGADAINPNQDIDWSETGDDLVDVAYSSLGANAANILRGAGNKLRGAKQGIKDFVTRTRGNAASQVNYPPVVRDPLLLGPASPRQIQTWGSPYKPSSGQPGYGNPGTPEFFPEGGYARGGKLPKAANGMLFGDEDDPYAQPTDFGPEWFDSKPGATLAGTQGEIAPELGGEYGERIPGMADEGGTSGLGGNILSGLVKYGLPAAYLGAEHAQIGKLRGMINPDLEAPELMTGAVRDLAKPDFSLPAEVGLQGSSLTEAQNAGLAREKYTRDARANWELNNSMNRQTQQNAILDRQNQAAMQKANVNNQEKMIAANNAFNEFGFLLQDRGTTASSLFQNLDNGISQAQTAKDARDLSYAAEVIRNPEKYPDEQAWARQTLSGRKGKKGKKKKEKGGTLTREFKIHV